MNIEDKYFKLIKARTKTVEMRLNTRNRQAILPGDTITFTNNQTKEELTTRVIKKEAYKSFTELYKHYPREAIGGSTRPSDMLEYFSTEEIEKYGALAITIALVEEK